MSDYIGAQIGVAPEAADLTAQINALKILETASTAELERLFAEHIDTCFLSLRLMAARTGQPAHRLATHGLGWGQ